MPVNGCVTGILVSALVALVLLPSPYLVPLRPELGGGGGGLLRDAPTSLPPLAPPAWFDFALDHFPPLDLFFTALLIGIGLMIYICEWIQRKVMERRIRKLNQKLGASIERLRAWDAQQEQLEGTLKMIQNATTEYNLLLYLVLRQHNCLAAPHTSPPSNCFFEKDLLDDDVGYIRNSPMEA